ncbi:MAG: hypothetical protein QXG00_03580 [Candidatus Woesearchaeota archaeon]
MAAKKSVNRKVSYQRKSLSIGEKEVEKIDELRKIEHKPMPGFLILAIILILIFNVISPIYALFTGSLTTFILYNVIIYGSDAMIINILMLIFAMLVVYGILAKVCWARDIAFAFVFVMLALIIVNLIGAIFDTGTIAEFVRQQALKTLQEQGKTDQIERINTIPDSQLIFGIIVSYIFSIIIYVIILIVFLAKKQFLACSVQNKK